MNRKLYFLSIVIIGIIVGSVGVLIWYNTYVQDEYDSRDNRISELEADIEVLVRNQELITTAPDPTTIEDDSGLPVAVFIPAGLFSPEQKASIQARLIDPYFAYYNEEGLYAATMQIEDYEAQDWRVTVINVDGSTSGFLYGNVPVAEQPWWVPDCFDTCDFSNAFRGAYPEVVNLYNGL